MPTANPSHENSVVPGSKTMLDKAVQNLIQMIFDVEAMNRTMLEFEIDLNRMPLGKISGSQISDAFSVLNELVKLFEDETSSSAKIAELSNQFYTLIPHDVGFKKLPLLNTNEVIFPYLDVLTGC